MDAGRADPGIFVLGSLRAGHALQHLVEHWLTATIGRDEAVDFLPVVV